MKKKIVLSEPNQIKDYSIKKDMDQYITHCKIRGMSPYTISSYTMILNGFINWLGDVPTSSITTSTIENFVIYCRDERKNNNTSIKDKLKTLRTFFKYCDLNIEMPTVRAEKNFKTPYTEDEIKKLLEKPTINSYTQWRNHAIISVLIGTGIRARTLLNLRIRDLDFTNNTIFLEKTKTNKQYYLPMSTLLKQTLKHYLSLYEHKDDDYLFVNLYGEPMNRYTLKRTIQHYNHMRGITKTSIHLFRHTFAINYLRNGGNIMYLKEILGHSKLSTTQIYLQINNEELKLNFDEYSPLDKCVRKGIKIKKK